MSKSKAAAAGRKRVIFFGDSICHGQHVSLERIFVAKLAAYVNDQLEPPTLFENRSINGNTTRQALERLSYDVTAHAPDLVYVQFGLNDCNVWDTDFGVPRVAPEAYAGNLREIVAKIKAAGTRRVVLGTNHRCLLGDAYEQRLLGYNQRVRDVAAETGCLLADIRGVTPSFDPNRMLLPDGIHLSEEGHDFYFEAFRGMLIAETRRLLEEEAVMQAVSGS